MTKVTRRQTLGVIATAPLLLAGASAMAGETHVVEIIGFNFKPRMLTIKAGDTVQWVNRDSAPHTATDDRNGWTTPRLNVGQTSDQVFKAAGQVHYHCAVHPSMKARIIVEG